MCAVSKDKQEESYADEKILLEAKTSVKLEKRFKKYSLLRVEPYTGRQHQIRVHLSHIGYPIVGDKLYGTSSDDVFFS